MTDNERADIRLKVASHMHTYRPHGRVPSPYMFGVWQKRLSIMTAVFLMVMITGGSGLAYASNDALPGDVLYSVKVNGVEEVQAAIKSTPQARAEFEVKRVEKRLGEAVTLATQGKLDEKKSDSIAQSLERHTNKVTEETSKLLEENPNSAVEVSAKLALSIEAHAAAITTAQEQNKVDGELDAIVEQVTAAQEHAEVEKAAATEVLVANGEMAVTAEDIAAKKERLMKSYVAAFGPVVIEDTTVPTDATTAPTDEMLKTEVVIEAVAISDIPVVVSPQQEIDTFFIQADELIAAGNTTEAFLALQKAEELLLKIEMKDEAAKNLGVLAPLDGNTAATPETATPTTEINPGQNPAETVTTEPTTDADESESDISEDESAVTANGQDKR